MGPARPEPALRLSKGRPYAVTRFCPRHTGESRYPEVRGNGVRSS